MLPLASVTVLMVSLYLVRPVEFTSFPTTLLLLTLLRLSLNWALFRLWEKGSFTDLWLRYFPISPF